MNIKKAVTFGSLAVLIILMMAATVFEKFQGTDFAFHYFYHHPLFIALWAVAAISGLCYFLSQGVRKKFWTLLLHLSWLVILAGALVSFLWGEKGKMHLREGLCSTEWTREDGKTRELPFSVELTAFQIDYYSGSRAAADYSSQVLVRDDADAAGIAAQISMNHILRHRGYRFYQADFDADQQGSTLVISHDPWGIVITYTGYLLLLLGMLGFFVQKGTYFRTTLSRLSGRSAVLASFLLLLLPLRSEARESVPPGQVLPHEVVEHFEQLYIYYNDRVCPFETLARDYCMKRYGKTRYQDVDAVSVVTGWLFYPDSWKDVPIRVKAKDRGSVKEMEQHAIFDRCASGDSFTIFPIAVPQEQREQFPQAVLWFGCNDALPEFMLDYENAGLYRFVRHGLDVFYEAVSMEDWAAAIHYLDQIRRWQEKTAAAYLPSEAKLGAEKFYNRIYRPRVPFMASVTLGILLFILSAILLSKGQDLPLGWQHALAVLNLVWVLYISLVLGLRWWVSGHAPFAGSYCVMMLMTWLIGLVMLCLYRRFPLVQPLGFILGGFTMLVASLSASNPQITHLMPVLQSPLLSIHVLSMMISYTLFGLIAFNGLMGLLVPSDPGGYGPSEKLRDVSLVILYPAVFLLTFGTFLGAVWANISWGSYWAWDPKETWALLTILVYAAALHSGSLPSFRRAKFFHLYTLLCFLSVLVTYFGVNLLLGGMHAYA